VKSIVVYYSQSGNTRKIAKAIQAGMGRVIKESDIAALKEISPKDLVKYDLIGLGSPVWGYKETPNMTAFINDIAGVKGKHAFPFCTHGTQPSGFMQHMIPALKRKGLIVVGFNDWYGGCINQVLPKPYFTDGHPDDIDLKEAEDFGREMAERSQRIYSGETGLIPKLPTIKELDEIYCGRPPKETKEFNRINNEAIKQKKINMEKCVNCGLCAANCPMNSIDFSGATPVFKSNCFGCFYCEQICPEGAIEIDFEQYTVMHDKMLRRLFSKRLDKAEAKGRFRRLVLKKDIGWNTHQYQIPGHPRYAIE
jgi:flavodoxin/NAD-dependent dihydropyrimidine dehydrogenase PreA subunit